MLKLTPKIKIRILRDGTERDAYNFPLVGSTLHWGEVFARADTGEFFVKYTDSDNTVKIKKFDPDRIKL